MKVQHLFLYFLLLWAALCCKTAELSTPKSTEKAITANPSVDGLAGATVSFDATTFTYTINVSASTDVKALKLSIPISAGATISPDPATARDYTNPVQYTITAEDGSKQVYTVQVVKAAGLLPTASFTVQNNGCTASCTINFTNTSTNASSYTWTFGDGTQATTPNATKQYTTSGSYTVTLRATGVGGTATSQQIVSVLGSATASGPTQVWDKSFGGSSNQIMNSMIATSDGGFLLGGTSESPVSGNKTATNYGSSDFWVVKINANGDKVWDKAFGGSGEDELTSMIATSDGGFLLGGRSGSPVSGSKTAPNYGSFDYWVVKINANGDKVWDKTFGGLGDDRMSSMIATSDGGFLLAGASYSSISGNKTTPNYSDEDYWVVKINANGDKVWDKTFGGSGDDRLYSIIATSDGGFLLAGASKSSISGNKTATNYGSFDYWVVKINANGDKVWDKTFGGSGDDRLYSIIATSDGGFLLAGASESSISGNKTATNYGSFDYWVVKINTNGDKVWDKTFGGSGFDGLYSIIATSDDGFLLAGHSNASLSGNRAAPSYGSSDYWMVKINANGDKVWDKAFGGSGEDGLTSIIATSDGGFLLGGRSSSPVSRSKTAPNYGVHDFWVVKVK